MAEDNKTVQEFTKILGTIIEKESHALKSDSCRINISMSQSPKHEYVSSGYTCVDSRKKNIDQKTTKLSGPRNFGLDIEKLHQCHLEISNESITSRKRPLSLIQSKSEQSKRFTTFGKDSEQTLTSLMLKHNIVTKTGQLALSVRNIELEFNGEIVNLMYNKNVEFAHRKEELII
ncbi:6654_t:CDS:2, partial [Diversispora eburnea]